jgi:hypothetical protein
MASSNPSSRRITAAWSSRARVSCPPSSRNRRSARASFCSMRASRESGSDEPLGGGVLETGRKLCATALAGARISLGVAAGATLGCKAEPSLGARDRAAESTERISDSSPLPGLTCRRIGGIAALHSWEVQRNGCRFHSASIYDRERPPVETSQHAKSWRRDGDRSQRTEARSRTTTRTRVRRPALAPPAREPAFA